MNPDVKLNEKELSENVPFIVYEAEMWKKERVIKRLCGAVFALGIALAAVCGYKVK
jgi:hypothetical protein